MKGIDIYQGDGYPLKSIPAKAYKESDFVIIKATQGTSYKYTNYFYKMMEQALKDKKLVGAYHYAAGGDPKKEAEYFVSIVKKYVGTTILVLDWESIQNKSWGNTNWCTSFINRVKELTGVLCFLYTGLDGLKQNKTLANKIPLWFAGYPTNENSWTVPTFKYNLGDWKKYTIWQFTSGGEKVDRNTTAITTSQWKAYAQPEKTIAKVTQDDITICGHGGGTPSLKALSTYATQRYNSLASNGKHKGIVSVKRLKALDDSHRTKFHNTYKTILGRNVYSQSLREYVYTKRSNGKYYSDCSSSGMATFKKIGYNVSLLNTAGIYNSNLFETVPVTIKNGHILNPEILKVGDCILFIGNDPSRPLQIGHVEYVYEISNSSTKISTTTKKTTTTKKATAAITKDKLQGAASTTKFTISKTGTPQKTLSLKGQITASQLYFRSWAGITNKPLSKKPILKKNEQVEICDSILASNKTLWYYIKNNNIYGFVSAKYVQFI